jgi:ribosomal protein S27E
MSSKIKKCKNCGTTNTLDFAPRKSVICKNCDKSVVQQPIENNKIVEEKIIENYVEIEIKDEKSLKFLIENLEESVKQIQEDIKKLNKIKKLFPRIFPEDNV